MIKKYKIGKCQSVHYFRPGKYLDDLSLKKLHTALVKVNENSGSNVINKMLDKKLTLEQIRNYFENTVVGTSVRDEEVNGFLMSPILEFKNKPIFHGGLIIIDKNPGENLVGILSLGNSIMAYKKLGSTFVTNISSTPSIIESFSKLFPGCWPSPDVKLKKPPTHYREVIKTLKENYMDKCFPDAEKLTIDYRRFILTSNSKEMGFTTDFYKISRADNFKYNLFCHAWVNYEKEEDIIQVGEMSFFTYLKMQFMLHMLKFASIKAYSKKENIDRLKSENSKHEAKAA